MLGDSRQHASKLPDGREGRAQQVPVNECHAAVIDTVTVTVTVHVRSGDGHGFVESCSGLIIMITIIVAVGDITVPAASCKDIPPKALH